MRLGMVFVALGAFVAWRAVTRMTALLVRLLGSSRPDDLQGTLLRFLLAFAILGGSIALMLAGAARLRVATSPQQPHAGPTLAP
jgi:hypothetical protein